MVVGLDSVSRLNFMRQLPKAYRLLTDNLDATVLIGFNKVGHNTFPNVVPMLTGRPLLETPHLPFKVMVILTVPFLLISTYLFLLSHTCSKRKY